MAIGLSHGGSNIYSSPSPSDEVLVGTARGVVVLRRDGADWHVAHRSLEDRFISSIIVEPESGMVFAGAFHGWLHASADGCPDDRPRLRVEIPGMTSVEIQVDPDRTAEYVVRFALAEEDVVHLSLTFLNDGSCAAGTGTVDKNVYIHKIWLESIRQTAK